MEFYYKQFLTYLERHPYLINASFQSYAGISFLILQFDKSFSLTMDEIIDWIQTCAIQTIQDTILSYESIFVRQTLGGSIFRFRFLVPNQKMFCCGNLCEDCILKS